MMFEQGRTWAKARMSRAGRAFKSSIGLASAFALVGCGGGGGGDPAITVVPAAAPAPVPVSTPTPVPTPTPTPSPTTDTASAIATSLEGLDPVASGIDVASYLTKSAGGTGAIAPSGLPDVVGAFRFICAPSHNAYDDPIVFPGQSGRAHLHTFFGNTATNASSTYQSLRTTGNSTCNNLLNRSAYWVPAMMTPAGKVVMPNYIVIYYKRRPATDPFCKTQGVACIPLPRGLRYIFGYNMSNPSASSHTDFICDSTTVIGPFKTIPEAAKSCPVGARIAGRLSSPSCWNGRDLDSPDHQSHMAYTSYGGWGYEKCPATHPYVVPTFTLGVYYQTDETLDRSGNMSPDAKTWYLSSDRMAGMPWQTPGSTLHADWFGAWEDSVMKMWTDNCINLLLSCSSGDLGNGQQMKTLAGYEWVTGTRLVDPPAKL